MTSVLVIDDHPIVLQGCRQLLQDAGASQVHQAATLSRGFRLYRQERPSVLVVDLALKSGALGGISFIRRLRRLDRAIPILVFSMHRDPVVVARAIEAGATGYILKDTPFDEFTRAFDRIRQGQRYLSSDVASDVVFMEARGSSNPLKILTARELQTLALLADGKPYSAIADELRVSYKTVANTCSMLKTKLGVGSLPELMRLAIEHLPAMTGPGKARASMTRM
jgi:two-component system invasion response regulator UvrY